MSEKHDKSTTKAEKVWIVANQKYTDYEHASPKSKMMLLPSILSTGKALRTLAKICEDPGKGRSAYSDGDKTAFYAVDPLVSAGLVRQERDPVAQGRSKFYPTEDGKSIYIGLWYAANSAALLPRLQNRGLPVPPVFWSPDSMYTLSRADESGYYFLVDTTTESPDRDMTIHDVFIDTDGDMWFSIDGLAGRFSIDIEDQLEADEGEARECLKEIVGLSRLKAAEMAAKAYDGLLDDADEE